MNDSNRTAAYKLIRIGGGTIGVAIVVAYSPIVLAALYHPLFTPLWFIASIPLAFLVGGHGLAMIADGIARIFRI